jgi:hypothetical protein
MLERPYVRNSPLDKGYNSRASSGQKSVKTSITMVSVLRSSSVQFVGLMIVLHFSGVESAAIPRESSGSKNLQTEVAIANNTSSISTNASGINITSHDTVLESIKAVNQGPPTPHCYCRAGSLCCLSGIPVKYSCVYDKYC